MYDLWLDSEKRIFNFPWSTSTCHFFHSPSQNSIFSPSTIIIFNIWFSLQKLKTIKSNTSFCLIFLLLFSSLLTYISLLSPSKIAWISAQFFLQLFNFSLTFLHFPSSNHRHRIFLLHALLIDWFQFLTPQRSRVPAESAAPNLKNTAFVPSR